MPAVNQERLRDMRADLTNLTRDHLESLIEGIGNPEPPRYKLIKKKIKKDDAGNQTVVDEVFPRFKEVYPKLSAWKRCLGYVRYADGHVASIHLEIDEHTGTLSVQKFPAFCSKFTPPETIMTQRMAAEVADAFEKQYYAVLSRVNKINKLRQIAYDMVNEQPLDEDADLPEGAGQSLQRLALTEDDISKKTIRSYQHMRQPTVSSSGLFKRPAPVLVEVQDHKRTKLEEVGTPLARVTAQISQVMQAAVRAEVGRQDRDIRKILVAADAAVRTFAVVGSEWETLNKAMSNLKEKIDVLKSRNGATTEQDQPSSDVGAEEQDKPSDEVVAAEHDSISEQEKTSERTPTIIDLGDEC